MIYTGAPQNTRRKDISELNIDAAWKLMEENDIHEFVIHAPYIINLGNTINPDTYQLATDFLRLELTRADACEEYHGSSSRCARRGRCRSRYCVCCQGTE